MEDLKKIQEFFSKPLNENKVTKEDFDKVVKILSKSKYPFTIMLVPKWDEIDIITGHDSPDEIVDDIGQRLDSAGLNWGGNSGITISGDSSNYSRREYSDIFKVNGGHKDYFEEASKEEENEFHKKLDKLVHKTFGHSSDEKKKTNEGAVEIMDAYNRILDLLKKESRALNDDDSYALGLKLRAWFEKNIIKENMSLDDQAKAYYLAKVKSGEIDILPENPKAAFLAQMTKDQMDHDKETLRRERGLEEADTNKNLKAIQIQLDQLGVKYEMDPKNKVQPFKAIYKPVNKDDDFYDKFDDIVFRYNLKGVVKTSLKETSAYIAETIKLGLMLNEELCDKGKRYIKARQAAGEKSSAYLSGRAVRVCKGQIEWPKKGKKKK